MTIVNLSLQDPLRRRLASIQENGSLLPQQSSDADNDKSSKRRLRLLQATRAFYKRLFVLLILLATSLLAANPFFVNFFEEMNYFFHKMAVVADFLLLKRRHKPRDKIIYYLHISKTGGTSLMDSAYRNGLSVPNRNGLTQRDWRCCGNEDTMQAQVDYFHSSRFDFVANEGDMYHNMDLEHYDYVLTLRDSKARYRSMWAQWQKDPVMFYIQPMNFTTWTAWFYEDNFMFRKICGSRCKGKPKYTLDRWDFNYTLSRLPKFDSILFLEEFEASFAKFAQKHSWKAPVGKERISHPVGSISSLMEDDAWDYQESALDDAVYEFAQRLDKGLEPYDSFSDSCKEHLETYFQKQEKKKK